MTDTIRLDVLKYAMQQRIGAFAAERLRAEETRDPLTGDVLIRIETGLLAEELPPLKLTDTDPFTVPRFATWRDHFAATYRGRWWGRLLGLHRRELRYVDEPHSHRTTVDVRTRWTYPRADTVLPADRYGHVVLKSQPIRWGDVTPW